jgi:hypothetical protein
MHPVAAQRAWLAGIDAEADPRPWLDRPLLNPELL